MKIMRSALLWKLQFTDSRLSSIIGLIMADVDIEKKYRTTCGNFTRLKSEFNCYVVSVSVKKGVFKMYMVESKI